MVVSRFSSHRCLSLMTDWDGGLIKGARWKERTKDEREMVNKCARQAVVIDDRISLKP